MASDGPNVLTIIQELTHAWQSQHAKDPQAYMAASVACQMKVAAMNLLEENVARKARRPAREADEYAYRRGKSFGEYNVEQIAQMVANDETNIIEFVRGTKIGTNPPENEQSLKRETFEWKGEAGVISGSEHRCAVIR
jgi:hypothetical protein